MKTKLFILSICILFVGISDSAAQSFFNRNLANETHNQIGTFSKNGITSLAFTPSAGWVITTKDGKSFARNIPQECHDKINEFLAQGHIIQHVAFPPKGGNSWTIITNKTFFSRNIPNEAHVEMGNLVKQGKKIKKVVFPTKRSTDNSWLILTEDGEFRARNIDDECYQILRNLSQSPFPGKPAPRKIHHVEFTKSGGWLVVADDYHFARNINNEAFLRMNTFRSNKDKIELVTFTPDEKGWSVISNQKFSTVPHDPIRSFEGNLENGIWKRMREIGVPGVSVAVVINDQVVWSTAYGFLKNGDTNAAAHPESFFQAGSVSKVLAAMGAHKMNDLKLIGLNDDIQKKLKNYTIPVQNCANADSIQVVTISKILNHRSGIDGRDVIMTGNNCDKLQGGGYFGYSQSTSVSRLPTLSQILNGDSPANTQKITLAYNTDTIRRSYYSGPAFTVLQKLTEDLTGRNYADWIKINILNPMGMGRSTFTTNPESLYQIDELTWGYYYNTKVNVRNRYPEFAAAGMYSNVQELGNVLITLNNQGKIKGKTILSSTSNNTLISGMGLNISDTNVTSKNKFYSHGGTNEGYRAYLIGFPKINDKDRNISSAGIVVMLNAGVAGSGPDLARSLRYELVNAIIKAYDW